MKLSKRLTALFSALLIAVTVFTSAIPVYAAEPTYKESIVSGSYKIQNYRTAYSTTAMKGQTKSNTTATRIATTIVTTTVDSKGNLVKPAKNKDVAQDNSTDSGVASVTSGSGNKFTKVTVLHSGLFGSKTLYKQWEYPKS